MRSTPTLFAVFLALAVACSRQKVAASTADACAATAPASASNSTASSLNAFEGEIDAIVTQGKIEGAPIPLALFVKADRARLDLPERIARVAHLGGSAYVIVDAAAKRASIVSDAKQQVLALDLAKTGEQLNALKAIAPPPASGGSAPRRPSALTKTGKYESIAGYSCENWDIASDHREGTVCVTEQAVPWFSVPATAMSADHPWTAELVDGKHFPLRFVAYTSDGAMEALRVEVTRIDRRTLAAAQVAYPPGYRVIDLAQILHARAGLSSVGRP